MGGAAPVESGKKGKKSLDAELNLVPFIDLLSCLISFLLITAVWTQISSLRVASTGGLQQKEQPPDQTTIDVTVTMTERGYTLSLAGNLVELPKISLPAGGTGYDTNQLVSKLKLVKTQYPEQKAVTVAAEDSVAYSDLVGTVDEIVGPAQLSDVSVKPAVN